MTDKSNTPRHTLAKIKQLRKQAVAPAALLRGIVSGDKTALARAITLLESTNPKHADKAATVIEQCFAKPRTSIRLGITGVPGVGKSTFIEVLGKRLTGLGKKVAVLAVDPSSALSQGSILGDKTRMETLAKDPNAFIRPSPTGKTLGGVAQKTHESIILCEAAGYEVILVETVGVGQSETAVHHMVDFFLLLKITGAGDALQGIKRGIVERADAIAINKADGDNLQQAQRTADEFLKALHLYPPKENGWRPKVFCCSATENTGIAEIWNTVAAFVEQSKKSGYFENNRKAQNQNWFLQTVETQILQRFYQKASFKKKQKTLLNAIKAHKISPFYAARLLTEAVTQKL